MYAGLIEALPPAIRMLAGTNLLQGVQRLQSLCHGALVMAQLLEQTQQRLEQIEISLMHLDAVTQLNDLRSF